MSSAWLRPSKRGLYCEVGDFFIDPSRRVERAVITHAHSDHARPGCGSYLTVRDGELPLRARLGQKATIQTVPYGEVIDHHGVRVSFHPAGHILGSAQIRLEYRGEVWVVSGDYKLIADSTCAPFEPVRCHVFVTESTFALPVYRWPRPEQVFGQINQWWRGNQETGKASVLYAYSLGKAQHLLSSIDPSIGPIFAHPSVEKMNELYRQMGVALPPTTTIKEAPDTTEWGRALILAPPSHRAGWLRRIGPYSAAFASGWMQTQSSRRRPEHGFVLSDHADWPGLLQAVASSGADRIAVTHGYDHVLVRWLREQGKNAWRLSNPE